MKHMKIRFEHIGAIKKVDLDLSKKLIVFCGPNGTGKTYTAYATFGFMDLLMVGYQMFSLNELIEKKTLEVVLDYDSLYKIKKSYASYLTQNIERVFGVDKKAYFKDFKTSIGVSKDEFQTEIHTKPLSYTYSYDNIKIKYDKKANSDTLIISLIGQVSLNFSTNAETYHLANFTKYICHNTIMSSHILPVERNSVYTFISELTLNKIDNSNLNQEEIKNRYPQAIRESLRFAGDLANIRKKKSEYEGLAIEIEEDILHGNILISDDGELQFQPKKCAEKILPIHLTASIIKNLSGLLIYLKHLAKNNDLLIIDEPEIGLHPDNQILLIRILAKMINKGLRLLISTHSDYIIRELNNLIMLSTANSNTQISDLAQAYNYHKNEFISPNDVGAYLFNYNEKGEIVVENLSIENNGFEISTIDKSISLLNNLSMELFWALNEEGNDTAE